MSLLFLLTFLQMLSLHQDMRSPRFAYKTEENHPDVVEVLAKHAFPLSHSLVSLTQMCSYMLCCIHFLL